MKASSKENDKECLMIIQTSLSSVHCLQAGVKIHGNTALDFVSKEMEQYMDEILIAAGKPPSNLFVNAYSSLGLRLILKNGTRLSIEGLFPPNYLTKDNFSLLIPASLGGDQLSVSLPVNFFSTK